MSGGLGAPLALSLLAHGGAVAAVAVLGAAWLGGSSPVPARPALYVDLVHPVVATGERREAPEAPAPRRRGARPRPSAAVPPPSAPAAAAGPADGGPAPAVAPMGEPGRPPSVPPEVAPPPTAPVVPGSTVARAESAPAAGPVSPGWSPTPLAAAPMPWASAAPPPADAVTSGPAGDASPVSPPLVGPVAAVVPPGGPADGLPTSSSGGAARRPSRRAGPRAPAGPPAPAPPGEASATVPDPDGERAAAHGAGLARIPSGEARGTSAPTGAMPSEYEAYVHSLRQRVQERLAYPWGAVRRGLEGVVELEVRVGADGRLIAVEVVAGASADALRTAAVAAVRGSAPFPFPPGLEARPLIIRLPVEFRLR